MKQAMLVLLMSALLISLKLAQGFPHSETKEQDGDASAAGQSLTLRSENSETMAEVSGEEVKSRGNACNCSRQRNDFVKPSCACQSPPKTTRKRTVKKSEVTGCQRKGIQRVGKCRKLKAGLGRGVRIIGNPI